MTFWRRNRDSAKTVYDGDIVISGLTVSDAKPEAKPAGKSLHRGSRFDLTITHGSTRISLDLTGTAMMNKSKYDVQVFPDKARDLEFLRCGSVTPWGKVSGYAFERAARMWTVRTDEYPDDVTYRPGAAVIVMNKM